MVSGRWLVITPHEVGLHPIYWTSSHSDFIRKDLIAWWLAIRLTVDLTFQSLSSAFCSFTFYHNLRYFSMKYTNFVYHYTKIDSILIQITTKQANCVDYNVLNNTLIIAMLIH